MRLPHFIDHVYVDDDLLLDAKVQLAVMVKTIYNEKYEKKFIIRRIHHIGSYLFLGRQETVKAYFYDEPEGENGIKSIVTSTNQFLIPRDIDFEDTSRIILYKRDVFKIQENDILSEVVLDKNNKPITIKYIMEEAKGFSDVGKGQKGRFYIPKRDYNVVVI